MVKLIGNQENLNMFNILLFIIYYIMIKYIIFIIFQCIVIYNFISINKIKSYIHKLLQKKIISNSNILNWINDDKINKYIIPDVTIKYSEISKKRGVFANKDYKKGDILEICPTIKHPKNYGGPIQKHVYNYDYYNNLIGFGYCSIYNISKNPNITYNILNDRQIEIKVIKDIKKNDEIFLT